MTKPIPDKAEVALEYPDKFYSGTFERSSRFEAAFDANGIALILERTGAPEARKSVHVHMHYGLFADVLEQLAATAGHVPQDHPSCDHLVSAVTSLHRAVEKCRRGQR
jgi:hypothetical protein